MQSPFVVILFLAFAHHATPLFSFHVGSRAPEDVVFLNLTETFQKEIGRPTYFVKTYSGNSKEPYELTSVKVTPVGRYCLASAGIVAGGPGHSFFTIGYAMPNNLMAYGFNVIAYKRIKT
ncbi:uncharacterized protein LOC116738566 [Nasonia vitripennis]|uniref:Uncharacterized protein n=1 Tax=Nasonia vitripennis TaxID=7425 RepID=A0A7M7QXN7_NASVI|nr:uncharacterized protein LOC116738566 [Nasonia vitripennis]